MTEDFNDSEDKTEPEERPLFPHPPWMVGVVLIFAVIAILAGFSDPIWLLLGAPCIIVLGLFIYIRVVKGYSRKKQL